MDGTDIVLACLRWVKKHPGASLIIFGILAILGMIVQLTGAY